MNHATEFIKLSGDERASQTMVLISSCPLYIFRIWCWRLPVINDVSHTTQSAL